MKLQELGLKTKPATKYFDHGYIRFMSDYKDLYYTIILFDKAKNQFPFNKITVIRDQQHLKDLLAIKTVNQLLELEH